MPISTIGQNGLNAPLSLTLPVVATTMGVGGATPSGSGSGISFPATQSASSDANTLDDYEEGTWTPVMALTSGTINSQTCTGQYTKVGRLVVLTFQIAFNVTSASGPTFSGLPFSIGNGSSSGILREATQTGIFWGCNSSSGTSAAWYRYDNSNTLSNGNNSFVGTYAYYTT